MHQLLHVAQHCCLRRHYCLVPSLHQIRVARPLGRRPRRERWPRLRQSFLLLWRLLMVMLRWLLGGHWLRLHLPIRVHLHSIAIHGALRVLCEAGFGGLGGDCEGIVSKGMRARVYP